LGFFPLYGESFVKGVVCPVRNKGEFWSTTTFKTLPPIFHWAQAAPTRYRDRSHCWWLPLWAVEHHCLLLCTELYCWGTWDTCGYVNIFSS